MVSRIVCSLLLMSLFVTAVVRAEDDYFYDEEADETETASSHVPKFTSRSETRVVKAGDNITLPCLVDKLGAAVIIWRAGDTTLFTAGIQSHQDTRFRLEDKGQLGNNLVIQGVSEKDSLVYQCQITSNPPITLKHNVMFQVAPSVIPRPRGGVMVVEEGKEVVLECSADGYPQPTVTWTKKGGLLPYREKKHTGERLVIPAVEGAHMGDYSCTADNGVGQPAVEHIRLEVNFAPQIEVASDIVYTGAGHEATVECSVNGQPLPQVMWFRVKGTALDEPHFQRYQEGYKYGIRIADVKDADLGVYSCEAENTIGRHTAMVHLTGKPKPVAVISEPNGNAKDMYKLRWSVESYAEPTEYKIVYRKIHKAGEPEPEWSELEVAFTADPDQADGSVVYEEEAALTSLQSAADYQAIVTARNQYGWSEPSDTFEFSTLGANEGAAGVRGGEALVSKQPAGNGALSLRSAGVTCLLAVLAALL